MKNIGLWLISIVVFFSVGCATYQEVENPKQYLPNFEYFGQDTIRFKFLLAKDTIWEFENVAIYKQNDTIVYETEGSIGYRVVEYDLFMEDGWHLVSLMILYSGKRGMRMIFPEIKKNSITIGWKGNKFGYINYGMKFKTELFGQTYKVKSLKSYFDTLKVDEYTIPNVIHVEAFYKFKYWDKEFNIKGKVKGIQHIFYYPNYGIVYLLYPDGMIQKNLTFFMDLRDTLHQH